MTDLDTRFETLRERVAAVTVAPDASVLVRRGRRRQVERAALACLLALALIAAGLTVGRPESHAEPVGPPPTTAPPWQQPKAERLAVWPTLIDGYRLHHTTEASVGTNGPTWWAANARTVDSVDLYPSGLPTATAYGELAVFGDEAGAHAAYRTIAADPMAAQGFPQAKVYRHDAPHLGDEALAVTAPMPADGAGEYTGQPLRVVAVRVGVAVVMYYGYPDAQFVDDTVRLATGWLCPYSPRCQPGPALPKPLTRLTDGGTAWAVAVELEQTADAPYGSATAALGELGYRASVVGLDCDEGSRAVYPTSGPQARYVVVYFASYDEAARLLPDLTGFAVRVVQVKTRCT